MSSETIPYRTYSNALALAKAVFERDVRDILNASFSGVFFGKLKITLEADGSTDSNYTYLKRPGWAVIHLSFRTACAFAGVSPYGVVGNKEVMSVAKLIKLGFNMLAYHEMGHLKHTDMTGECFKAIPQQDRWADGFIHGVSNILEDPTEEKELSHESYYRFTKALFRMGVKRIFMPQARRYKDDGSVDSLLDYILLYLRCGPKAIAGRNARFDALASKGLLDKIREAHRERDATKRCKKQIGIAIWLINELGLKEPDVASQAGQTRAVIILVDKKDDGTEQQRPLTPQTSALPPVSVAEAEDGDGEEGETPDADIIDMRKKKDPGSKEQDDGEGATSASSDSEEEEGGDDGEAADSDSKSESKSDSDSDPMGGEGDEDEEKERILPSLPNHASESDKDEEGDEKAGEGKGNDGAEEVDETDGTGEGDEGDDLSGEEDEFGDGAEDAPQPSEGKNAEESTGQTPEGPSKAGDEAGDMPSEDKSDFDWEIGEEDPADVAAENAMTNSYDSDLDRALRLDAMNLGNNSSYRAIDVLEIVQPNWPRNAFDNATTALGGLPSCLAETLSKIKAETAPYERHLLPEGEDVDIDDFIDARASRSCTLDVFKNEEPGREITDLAVSLLIDCSGSMKRDKCSCAFAAAITVVLACEEADIPTEVGAFSTGGILYLKQFEDDPSICRDYLAALDYSTASAYKKDGSCMLGMWGGTDCESALAILLNNLEKYDGKQCKLVFVITDGDTGDPQKVGALVKGAREQGTVVVGIGIGTSKDNLRTCFDHCRSFSTSSLKNLPDYVAGEIQMAVDSNNFRGY